MNSNKFRAGAKARNNADADNASLNDSSNNNLNISGSSDDANGFKQSGEIIDELLKDTEMLHSSTELYKERTDPDFEETISSKFLPKGLTENQFKKFAYFIYSYFNTGLNGNFLGGNVEYTSPEYLFFKGSSVTCLKYANDRINDELKFFDSASDYDVGLVSSHAIHAMYDLVTIFQNAINSAETALANQLAAFISKIDPGSTGYLDIHNKDKHVDQKDDEAKRRFFPDGTPHIKLCDALNGFVNNGHLFNFVMVESLKQLKYPTKLVENESKVTSNDAKDILQRCKDRVGAFYIHETIVNELHISSEKDYKHPKPILVYTWKLIAKYHNLFRDEFPHEANALQPIIVTLQAECQSQRDYARNLLTEARNRNLTLQQPQTLFSNSTKDEKSDNTKSIKMGAR